MAADAAPVVLDTPALTYQYYGLWVQAGAIVASAIGVIITLIVNRSIARRRATLDLILLEETNLAITERRRKFVALREAGFLAQWATRANLASEEASMIRAVLNGYELIAVGIANHTLDANIYKRWYRTTVVKDWTALKDFVAIYQREHNPKLFCEYEALAKSWATETERKHC